MSSLQQQVVPLVSILAVVGTWVAYLVAGQELTVAVVLVLRVGGVSLAGGIVAVCLLGLPYLAWLIYQKAYAALEVRRAATAQRQILEAQAFKERREAEVLVVTAKSDEQVHIRDLAHGQWRAAHLDARVYANGVSSLPTALELAAWLGFHHRNAQGEPAAAASFQPLLAGGLPERIDLPQLLPGGRGSLRNIIVGVRLDETGQLRTVSAIAGSRTG